MPLVMLCGQPSSGKSTLAARLAQLFEAAGHVPVLVGEAILNMEKNLAYAGGRLCFNQCFDFELSWM